MRTFKHHHPCQRCKAKTECFGQLEDNYDGWPEIVCLEFHMNASCDPNPDFLCDGCLCWDCGDPGVVTMDGELVCEACAHKREQAGAA